MFIVRITGTDPEVSHGKIKKAIEAGLADFDIEWDRIHIEHEFDENHVPHATTVSMDDPIPYLVKPGKIEEI